MPAWPVTIAAVSYTHLDVYKRQGHTRHRHPQRHRPDPAATAGPHRQTDRHAFRARWPQSVGNAGLALPAQLQGRLRQSGAYCNPVSYTHLDVYKRQILAVSFKFLYSS